MTEAAKRRLVLSSMACAQQRLTSGVHCGSVTTDLTEIRNSTDVCIIADRHNRVQEARGSSAREATGSASRKVNEFHTVDALRVWALLSGEISAASAVGVVVVTAGRG
jgi:hypothetical protein